MTPKSDLVIKTLKLFGFSASEIAIYTVLVENDFLIVSEISKLSNVPRTKTYEILDKLELKDVLQKEEGHPVKYRAKNPLQTLKTMKKQIINDTEQGLELLQESWDQRESIDDLRPVAVYYGSRNYYKIINKLEKDVEVHIYMLIKFLVSSEEIQLFKNIITTNLTKGVTIELVVHPAVKDQLDQGTLNFFSNNTKFQITPIPMRVFIVDNAEMILQIPTTEESESLDPDDIHNVVIRLPDLVKTIEKSMRSAISQFKV